ncbi:MAG: hypothetical protein H5U40_02760 [Polyangiaceae bacterium]|nr:hypothetical protein [Polyangiaceae bacterium]
MYLNLPRDPKSKHRTKTKRFRAKKKAHQRRRVNGMQGRKLGRRLTRNG